MEGADIVVESCTKYLSGGARIAGHISFSNAVVEEPKASMLDALERAVTLDIRHRGIHVAPETCRYILGALETLPLRMGSARNRTCAILEALRWRGYTYRYSFDRSGLYIPCVLLLELRVGNSELRTPAKSWKKAIRRIVEDYHTSYGKPYDAFCSYPTRSTDRTKLFLRLSVGYDNVSINRISTRVLRD
jgi:hypothetical protein